MSFDGTKSVLPIPKFRGEKYRKRHCPAEPFETFHKIRGSVFFQALKVYRQEKVKIRFPPSLATTV